LPFQRRHPRRTRRSSTTSRVVPTTSSATTTLNAIQGWLSASSATVSTVTSSPRLVPTLVTGSGEVFTASRSPALTACDASAVPPPSTA
jgi:hypothetical protein